MNKKLIKLTEQDLHRIVKESVNRILREGKVVNNKPYFPNGRGGYITKDEYASPVYDFDGKIPQSEIDKHNERYIMSHPREDYINPLYRQRDVLADREAQIRNSKETSSPLHIYSDTIQGKLGNMRYSSREFPPEDGREEGNYWDNLYGDWDDRLAMGNDLD